MAKVADIIDFDDEEDTIETKVKFSFELTLAYEKGDKRGAIRLLKESMKVFLNNEFEDGINGYMKGTSEDQGIGSYAWVVGDVKHFKVK